MDSTQNDLQFRKSSFSGPNDGCVDVADLSDGGRVLRNSKDPGGPRVSYTAHEWQMFIAGVKAGEFD
ncbi:DUF397 domain-containing protein [Streptosporangium sp. NBC_01810]|uniref:DUF397 domain-containing protein n=1 Tax=Streptosporangium sp. NBC_01810 TaxID=2975951 RepID=UPI002DDA97CE|nr:DUF397 domain-containing protein [Streptosporangium sp. NBC_01810]WSA23642.1 DUF397 domain-containing protein [Streptosporangium sp. NBC_01810]